MKSKGWNVRVFKREQRSLFGEILDWMLTPLLLLWPISLALTWLVAQGLANKPFDRALVYNVQALAQQVRLGADKRVEFSLPQPASETAAPAVMRARRARRCMEASKTDLAALLAVPARRSIFGVPEPRRQP